MATKLQPRERMVLIIGAIGVFAIAAYGISQGPYQTYVQSKEKLADARENLRLAKAIQLNVQREQEKQKEILNRLGSASDFNLWNEIDKAVKDLKLGARCSMRSNRAGSRGQQGTSVDVTLTGVSNQELVELLHRIYDTGKLVLLSEMQHLKPSPDKKGLDCRMTFIAPQA
ncbi:MAG: hypothetical protein IT366_21235 [Candidatus Hydrogenedentes bacterium]|nr:hypothetical protein [Candidatus Hydrogenedentota bacterium]